jgi:hypothetical protein
MAIAPAGHERAQNPQPVQSLFDTRKSRHAWRFPRRSIPATSAQKTLLTAFIAYARFTRLSFTARAASVEAPSSSARRRAFCFSGGAPKSGT